MNCLESRRWLLAAPREQPLGQHEHIAFCEECARLAHHVADLEHEIAEAALVPPPDALAHRILLAKPQRSAWRYAAAAAITAIAVAGGLVGAEVVEAPGFSRTVHAVGPSHPAVVAIAEVIREEPHIANSLRPEQVRQLEQGLARLGLTLKRGAVNAEYVGKCRIEGSECEHIVLSTPDAHANVILVPDYPLPDRVLVIDGRMVALVSPAGRGGYIVVANSVKTARKMERLLVKG